MSVRCPVCAEELESEEALAAHNHAMPPSWQEGGAGFPCPECGVGFDSEEDLVKHQAMDHEPTRADPDG